MAAEAPPSGGVKGSLTRKVGPLPAWAWAAVLLVGYFLYTRMKGSGNTPAAAQSGTAQTGADMNPVPVGTDQTDSGLGAGSFGQGPTNIYNYYGVNPNAPGVIPSGVNITGTQPGGGQPTTGGTGTSSPGGQAGSDPGPISAPGPIQIHGFGPGGTVTGVPVTNQPTDSAHLQEQASGFVPAGVSSPGKNVAV